MTSSIIEDLEKRIQDLEERVKELEKYTDNVKKGAGMVLEQLEEFQKKM